MRRFLGGLLLLLLVKTAFAQPDSWLREAEAAYHVGDYPRAAALYEDVIASGDASASLYFNLGNAYFEQQDLGRALVNYRRAKQGLPRDADVYRNLALTRALRVDVQGDEGALIDQLAMVTVDFLTVEELTWAVFVLWVAWCGVLIFKRGRRMWVLGVGGGLLLMASLLGVRLYGAMVRPPVVVVDFRVQIMSGPGEDYVPLFTLHAAAEGRQIEQRGGWSRVLLPDGRQGWLKQESIEQG